MAIGKDIAPGRIDDAADDTNQCCLAGTIRAKQGKDLSATDIKVNIFKCLESGVVDLVEVFD